MKKYLIRYLLEFLVIVLGISISFYVEKKNAIAYKEELKSESLKKMKSNLLKELDGLHFDVGVHSQASDFSNIIYERGKLLYNEDKDSLGFYLSYLKDAGTVFVHNEEEYSALVNSGLIELIENRELVSLLQEKYSDQTWYEKNNHLLLEMYLRDNTFDKFFSSENRRLHKNIIGYWTSYKPNMRYLNDLEINKVSQSGLAHSFYANLMRLAIRQDSLIIKEIDKELAE
ncbi:MAG: hypothetical protein CMC19_10350 [Flavobacteriaceae bacterium]|nr:hypothetical protein [Flavobacteriaceae bacterium]